MLLEEKIENFDAVYKILYDSFPEDERRDYEAQKALMNNEKYIILSSKIDGRLVGFLAVWNFAEFVYLEHFAVSEAFRNGGRGSVMLQKMVELFKKPVILEVELPQTEITKRRIGFYKRNGFYYNEYEYVQLPYSKDKSPVPLRIMSYPRAIDEKEFEQVRDTIYKEVFGVKE